MTDLHSHILPEIDDGSSSIEESQALLHMLRNQGVKTVVATPHFYPNRNSLERFLEKRQRSFDTLCPILTEETPHVLLGAEVKYYDGIRRMEGLEKLCIEGSRVLLLEMPFEEWSEMTIREVEALSRSGKVQVMLAHIDRYFSYMSGGVLERLIDSGVMLQVNASAFCGLFTRRRVLSMCSAGLVHGIGSDCHNVNTRPPQIGKAIAVIEKRIGKVFLDQLNDFTGSLLRVSK